MSATIIAIVYANGQLAEYVADKHPAEFSNYIRSATVAEWTSAITGDSKGWAAWAQKYKAAGTAIVGYLMCGSTAPANPQTPSGNWRDRLNGAIVLCGAPNYYWHKQPSAQREAILDAVAASGIDGLHFEFGGEFIVMEYIKKPMGGTFQEIYRQRIADFAPWIAGIRARGLIADVTWINTNQSKADKLGVSDHVGLVNKFLNTHGTDNLLILPYSETDSRTTRYDAVIQAFKARLGDGQLIRYASGQPGNWFETHPSTTSKITGKTDSRTIICSDSGGIIKELKGSSWTGGGATNTANMAKFAAACRGISASCVEYSFAREFDFTVPTILAAAYGRGGWNMPLVNGPEKHPSDAIPASSINIVGKHKMDPAKATIATTIKSASLESGQMRLSFAPSVNWYKQTQSNGKTTDGGMVLVWRDGSGYVGGWWDHHGVGQVVKTMNNVRDGYIGVKPAIGAETWMYLISYNGKERSSIAACGKWPG